MRRGCVERYRAPAVRRVHIPKPGKAGKTRPIGIPTLEDKVLQRAMLMVLEPIYEQDFLECSYGFRPGRGAHQALDALWQGLMQIGGGWVIDLDIQNFFEGHRVPRVQGFADQATRGLTLLDSAEALEDLAGLPSNRLEVLRGRRAGQNSIRLNLQWRICFLWESPHKREFASLTAAGRHPATRGPT